LLNSVEEINAYFRNRQRGLLFMALARDDVDEIVRLLTEERAVTERFAPEYVTMGLSLLNDIQRPLPASAIELVLDTVQAKNVPILHAELLRALSLSDDRLDLLGQALEEFEAIGAGPYAARVRCEISLATTDRAKFDDALAYLESIGDEVQVERYLKRWSSRGS
jgi:hypothetical protein